MCVCVSSEKMTTATYFFLLSLISTQHVDVEIWVGVLPLPVCVCHGCRRPHVGYYSHCHEHQQYKQFPYTSVCLSIQCQPFGDNRDF